MVNNRCWIVLYALRIDSESHNDACCERIERWCIALLQHMAGTIAHIGANEFPLHATHDVNCHRHRMNLAASILNLLTIEGTDLYTGFAK